MRLSSLPLVIGRSIHVFFGFGACCRFRPTCSDYCRSAVETHGWFRGALLAVRRLTRCHPWGSYGYDPIPPETGVFRGR